jgi:hypothetical protein
MAATFSTLQPPRGKPFEKGMAKTGGRKAGVQNVHTRTVRWAIGEAARRVGGVDRLAAWIMESVENERLFWTQIWPRLLPLRVEGTGERGEIEIAMTIKPEELDQALAERGLPTTIFGIDVPTLDIEPQRRIENGSTSWPPEDSRC